MKTRNLYVGIGVFLLMVAGSLMGQLQQSGGASSNASVSATGATAPASATLHGVSYNSSLPTLSSGQMGALQSDANGRLLVASIAGALPTGGNTIGNVGVTGALPAGTNVLGTVTTIPKTACGTTVLSQPLAAVPTTVGVVASATTCVTIVALNNTTAGTLTVTVSDNQGSPINDILTFSIPAYSQVIQPLGGVQFTSGVKWVASNTGVTGAVLGYQ